MDNLSLAAFLAVAHCRSFSLAANELFITQPAVSKRVSRLEQDLGVKLFDRIGRSISLTEAGQRLLPRARAMAMDMADTRRVLSNLTGLVDGRLTIGTSHHIGLHRLPPVLQSYTKRHPAVQMDLKFIDSEEAFNEVLNGTMELGIVTLPPDGSHPLIAVPLWPDPLQCVVSADHALITRKGISLAELTEYPAVLPGRQTFTRRIFEALVENHKLNLNVAISTNYLETLRMMVAINLGWSILPETMVDDSIRVVEVTEIKIKRQLGLVHHPDRTLSNAAQELIKHLRAHANSHTLDPDSPP